MKKAFVITLIAVIGLTSFAYGAYIPIKAELAQLLILRSWSESIGTGEGVKPWPWADMHPVLRLQSEKHDQDLIVLSGDTGNVLAFGPGLSGDTPNLDNTSSLMISAHRDTHFAFLKDVNIGDRFITTSDDNRKVTYQVSTIEIIDTTTQDIHITDSKTELILVTCYPFDAIVAGGPLRYVVSANLVKLKDST